MLVINVGVLQYVTVGDVCVYYVSVVDNVMFSILNKDRL